MWFWRRKQKPGAQGPSVEERIRSKYQGFRELLTLNNESLELMAGLQEDLQFVPPHRDILETRVASVFEKVESTVRALEKLSGFPQPVLTQAVHAQRLEVERYMAALQELVNPRLSAWLHEIGMGSAHQVGGKAAALGEVKSKLGLAVPNGYVLTTEAYLQFCGIPLWTAIRDAVRDIDLSDLNAVEAASAELTKRVMECPIPRAIEVAITERAHTLLKSATGLAVRSSAVGEGGARTYAGQFTSLLNVPTAEVLDAYKRVVAGRFRDRALFYRLSTGTMEVDSPMAVLFLPLLAAKASGILYTRDPNDPRSKTLWITATWGLGSEIASGRIPADLFLVSRSRPHRVLEQQIVSKREAIVRRRDSGLERQPLRPGDGEKPSLETGQIERLADWGMRIEQHFRCPQDIEWVLDESGEFWIVQARPLALGGAGRARLKAKPKTAPLAAGGRTVYPGQVSGNAVLIEEGAGMKDVPLGAIAIVRRPSPEIVQLFPRIAGLVAEWGNVTGHAAALLREFRVPSVFQMAAVFDRVKSGDAISLDSVQAGVYPGTLWATRTGEDLPVAERYREAAHPVSQRLLALNLLDPSAGNFRPSGCKSAHDVLRYCHEKAIEAMFAVGDMATEIGTECSRELVTSLPLNILALDLGAGFRLENPDERSNRKIKPSEISCRPFQSLWKGISHPGVSWTREMPASFSDLASVLARSLTPQGEGMRGLGERSYLLVADEYMNLNSRLAYHFSLVDACLSDVTSKNYISFRFEGGGTTRWRRNLRACFIEACLKHHGYQVDRTGDLVNAWYRKGPPDRTAEKLDVLGRLLACSSQLDMYMTSHDVMRWYVRQFLEGNYAFTSQGSQAPTES